MTPFLHAYFSRLGWEGTPETTVETLRKLHLLHNCAIPFENIDVLLPREMQLDDQSLQDKLITARRGGYCFEQNGLLERALHELGLLFAACLDVSYWQTRRNFPRERIAYCWWMWKVSAG
jgi:Arylamine N-acetyltransferase